MPAAAAALLSGMALDVSVGLGEHWAFGWVAAVPVLYVAFGPTSTRRALAGAFAAYAIAGVNYLSAYGTVMPPAVVALAVMGPALLFLLAVGGGRVVYRRFGPLAGVLAFALLWAGLDFLASFGRTGGAVMTPSAPQIDAPIVVQTASLVGFCGVTFLLGAVNASLAAAWRERRPAFVLAAVCLLAGNTAFGAWRMSKPGSGTLRVALIASNDVVGDLRHEDEAKTRAAIDTYAAQLDRLGEPPPALIVLPENIARVAPTWRDAALAPFEAASRHANATIVAGLNTSVDGAQRNVSWAFVQGAPPVVYAKRHLVRGLETPTYTPGDGARVLTNGIGLEICKDMDHPRMVRADAASLQPAVLAVPAWDFGRDGWAHARIAIMRSVENGVPMARAAREGWLTLNDRYGRVVARAEVTSGFATLVGAIPVDGRGGATLYSRFGDVFGWMSAVLGSGLVVLAMVGRRSVRPDVPVASPSTR